MNQKICKEKRETKLSSQYIAQYKNSSRGLIFALIVLIGNGLHPIINNLRPEEFISTIFVLQMSLWEFFCAFIVLLLQKRNKKEKSKSPISKNSSQICFSKKNIIFRMLIVGLLFSIATYGYVEGLKEAGSISGSIALKISPIYAIIIGFLFLGERLNGKPILITIFMLLGIYYLGTNGTFLIDQFSIGFAILLVVPFLWTIAHALTKPLLENKILVPNQVIFIRTGIISFSFLIINLFIYDWSELLLSFINPSFLLFSFLMGFTYFFMHYSWYSSIIIIDLSFASALVTPSPAITTLIALLLEMEDFHYYQLIGMIWAFIGLYGLIIVNKNPKKKEKEKKEKNEIKVNNLI
ncbi:DMT family transporter [Promethearchaeum syntrophicum]|uniref:DMT family transporter n=1 Tax=Promethearchaeum syntrophicum TaxID=2594042 RepID=A0A5B9D9X0_9ARCH|nr:DMT family transporter [Candidatus Prometheoarchaeum syntrophicum]QEE15811.1 EamA-like transporter family protein [Candidatus Prometheoarchaeum syntrophicum]